MKQAIGIILIIISLLLTATVLYIKSSYSQVTRTYSSYALLHSSWEDYKERFIQEDGRVLDYSQGAVTTSEGQSYAMLRSVWIDDKATFDHVWGWTQINLQRDDDALFGWRWGQREDQSYGFIENGGENSASDANVDIALALILAGKRWDNPEYIEEAQKILDDIWELEIAEAQGKRYLIAGNWAQNEVELVLNPSYFAPYAFRIFDDIDDSRDWRSLIDPAYQLLENSSLALLNDESGVGLAPNWVAINRETGALSTPDVDNLNTQYGFDAMRTPWRTALDYIWNEDSQAKEYLQLACTPLMESYTTKGRIASVYSHDGEVIDSSENPTAYSTALGCFKVINPDLADTLYQEKIVSLYANDEDSFNPEIPYYEQNWLWFGAALYHDQIINYAK